MNAPCSAAAAMLFCLVASNAARAETCAYLMRGIIFGGPAMQQLAAALRRGGVRVRGVGDWGDGGRFRDDALAHPHCVAVFIGHSQGARSAADAANEVQARGGRAGVVGIDPLLTGAAVLPGVAAVSFNGGPMTMAGARNVDVSRYGDSHVGLIFDARVQAAVVAAVRRW